MTVPYNPTALCIGATDAAVVIGFFIVVAIVAVTVAVCNRK